LLVAYGIKFLFTDTRDGTVSRIGKGPPKQFGTRLIIPASSESRPYALNLYAQEINDLNTNIEYSLLLIHGTCGHGGGYGNFVKYYQLKYSNVNIYALDLQGHGYTGKIANSSGIFQFENWIKDIDIAAKFIRLRYKNPIKLITLGLSQGGEVSFHANSLLSSIDAGISMNVILFSETTIKPLAKLLKKGPIGDFLELIFGNFVLPIFRIIDFKEAYDWDEEPSLYEGKLQDPLSTWNYGFSSYRSVFTYESSQLAKENKKPILIMSGGSDKVIPPSHIQLCYELIGGPKNLVLLENGRHQLMNRHMIIFTEIVHSWINAVLNNEQKNWKSPYSSVPAKLELFL